MPPIPSPPHPGADMARLHDDLDGVIADARAWLAEPEALSFPERQRYSEILTSAVRAKVGLCEIGVWPSPDEKPPNPATLEKP